MSEKRKTIWIITKTTGEWSDRAWSVVGYCETKEQAEKLLAKYKEAEAEISQAIKVRQDTIGYARYEITTYEIQEVGLGNAEANYTILPPDPGDFWGTYEFEINWDDA